MSTVSIMRNSRMAETDLRSVRVTMPTWPWKFQRLSMRKIIPIMTMPWKAPYAAIRDAMLSISNIIWP